MVLVLLSIARVFEGVEKRWVWKSLYVEEKRDGKWKRRRVLRESADGGCK